MNCEKCTKPFNHSDRTPYALSCSHTFCLNCIDNLNSCPNCNVIITIKNPNFVILNMILKTKINGEQLISIFETLKTDIKVSEYLDYAKFFSKENKFEEAIFYFDKVIDLNPDRAADVYNEKGLALFELKDYKKAIECYTTAIDQNPKEAEYYFRKAEALKELGRYMDAVDSLDMSIKLDQNNSLSFSLKGVCFCEMDNHKKALDNFNSAIKLDPTNSVLYCNKGESLRRLNRFKESLSSFNKAIEINPDDHIVYYSKAITLIELKDDKEAIIALKKAIEINPNYSDSHRELGCLFSTELQKEKEALYHYERALEINPDDPETLNYKGILHLNKRKPEYKKAIECFDRAICISPHEFEYNYNKVFALFCSKKYANVIESVNLNEEMFSNRAAAINLKGMSLKELKRYDEAIIELNEAIRIDPKFKEYSDNKKLILEQKQKNSRNIPFQDESEPKKRSKKK